MTDYYGSIDGADDYFAARGNVAWGLLDDGQKLAALIRGSQVIDTIGTKIPEYGVAVLAFSGSKTGGRAQYLQWPRTGAVDANGDQIPNDEVPVEVEYAAYEAASREASSPNSLLPDVTIGKIIKKQVLGQLEQEFAVSADGVSADEMTPVITLIMGILSPVMIKRRVIGAAVVV